MPFTNDDVDVDMLMFNDRPSTMNENRRLAPKACFSCRTRKVRCDATRRGTPCTNCIRRSSCCMMADSASSRPRNPVTSRLQNGTTASTPTASSESTMSDADYLFSLSFDELGGQAQKASGSGSPPSANTTANEDHFAMPLPQIAPQAAPAVPQAVSPHGLPLYIRPLPAHLTAEDIDLLARHGALTLPEDDLQHELFRKYIMYAFAFMPVINMAEFFTPISRHHTTGTVSLLVYQAVMFASAAYVDPEYSAERGYQGRKSLRKAFFKRARLLYDLNCEQDPMAVLQALLLMTCWYEKSEEDEEETWQLMGVALSLAKSLGVHKDPEHLDMAPEVKQLRKKIWWGCFVRDRLLALGMGRPARIRPGDYDVPMLTMEECEMEPLEDDILRWVGPIPMADDCPTKANIYLCFVELVQLCLRMGDVLLQKFSILSNPANVMAQIVSVMAMPKTPAAPVYEMQTCGMELQGWQQSLTPGCRYKKGQLQYAPQVNESHRLLRLYQALLHIVYLTATTVLHQSEILETDVNGHNQGSQGHSLVRVSREMVTDAAADITDVVSELSDDDQLRFAPSVAIPALMSATLTHLIDLGSSSSTVRYASIGRFFMCWQALHCLGEMYASADHAVSFLETVITKTGIRIPMITMPPMLRHLGPFVESAPASAKGQIQTRAIDQSHNGLPRGMGMGPFRDGGVGGVVEPPNPDIVDQTVDYIHAMMASGGPGNGAAFGSTAAYGAPPAHYALHGFRHNVTELQPDEPEAGLGSAMVDDQQVDPWNGIEIGEDLFQTLDHFNTHTAFSLSL